MRWARIKDFMSLVSSVQRALLLAEPSSVSDGVQFWVLKGKKRERLASTENDKKRRTTPKERATCDDEADEAHDACLVWLWLCLSMMLRIFAPTQCNVPYLQRDTRDLCTEHPSSFYPAVQLGLFVCSLVHLIPAFFRVVFLEIWVFLPFQLSL